MSEVQLLKSILEELRYIKTDFRNHKDDVNTKLEVLSNNTNKAAARTLEFKMNTNSQEFDIYPPLEVNDGEYGLGLSNFSVYHSIHNVDASNNLFRYKRVQESVWREIYIPEGAYEVEHIDAFIKKQFPDPSFEITANQSTLKCEIVFADRWEVDFTPQNTIGRLLGFDAKILSAKAEPGHEGEKYVPKAFESSRQVNISGIDKVHMKCNMIQGSTLNGRPSNILFSFLIDQSPGYLIFKTPNPVSYKKVEKREAISSIGFSFEDDDGKPVNFNGETITFSLELKKM